MFSTDSYNNHFQNTQAYEREMQWKTMPVKIKNAMASDIFIRYHTIFLELNIEIDLLKKSTPRKSLLISPFFSGVSNFFVSL